MKTENNVSLMLRQGYYFSKICAVEITQNQLEGNLPIKITLPMKKLFYSRSVVTGGFRLRYASQRKKKTRHLINITRLFTRLLYHFNL